MSPTTQHRHPGLTDEVFDDLAAQVASAYARDDMRQGDRLYADLHVRGIDPHAWYFLPWLVPSNLDREDVYVRVLERIITSLKAGKPFKQAFLYQLYKWSISDVWHAPGGPKREENHETRRFVSDDEVLEDLIDKIRRQGDSDEYEAAGASIEFATFARQVEHHLRHDLNRPTWAVVFANMAAGVTDGPSLAKAISVETGKPVKDQVARRVKSEVSKYLTGIGRHFFERIASDELKGEA